MKKIYASVSDCEYDGWALTENEIKDMCEWISGFITRQTGDDGVERNEQYALYRTNGDGEYFSHIYLCIARFQDIMEPRKNRLKKGLYDTIQRLVIGMLVFIKNNNGQFPGVGRVDVWMRAGNAYMNLLEYKKTEKVLLEGLDVYVKEENWKPGKLSEMDIAFEADVSKQEILMAYLCKCYFLAKEYNDCIKIGKKLLNSIKIRGKEDYIVENFPNGIKFYINKAKD